jgi:hypothetical protein
MIIQSSYSDFYDWTLGVTGVDESIRWIRDLNALALVSNPGTNEQSLHQLGFLKVDGGHNVKYEKMKLIDQIFSYKNISEIPIKTGLSNVKQFYPNPKPNIYNYITPAYQTKDGARKCDLARRNTGEVRIRCANQCIAAYLSICGHPIYIVFKPDHDDLQVFYDLPNLARSYVDDYDDVNIMDGVVGQNLRDPLRMFNKNNDEHNMHSLSRFLAGESEPNQRLVNMHKICNSPVIISYICNTNRYVKLGDQRNDPVSIIIINPSLIDLGLAGEITDHQRFSQMIQSFMLSLNEPEMMKIHDDGVMLNKKGFDSKSFKTDAPSPKKARRKINKMKKRGENM